MGDIIYVNFAKHREKKQREQLALHDKETGQDLQRRVDNIQGSVNRLNRLLQELRNPSSTDLTSEELDKILDEVYTRR